MADDTTSAPANRASWFQVITGLAVLFAAMYGLYRYAGYLQAGATTNLQVGATTNLQVQALTFLIMVGLALVIALMAGLGIVYSMLGVADPRQALALPEGSIRALIAFSLLLIFVCLATFVYKGAESSTLVEVGQLKRATAQQVAALEKTFTVAAEPARNEGGALATDPATAQGGTPVPLFNATYYSERGREANEIGKQIFTTLATVFVSVISFYFGSSTTASAVGAGMKAASGDGGTPTGSGKAKVPAGAAGKPDEPPAAGV